MATGAPPPPPPPPRTRGLTPQGFNTARANPCRVSDQVLNSFIPKTIATIRIRYIRAPAIAPMAVHTSHCHIVVYAIIFALGLYMAVAAVDVAPEAPVRGRLTLLMAGIAATLIGMLLFWMGCINCSFLRHMWRAFTQRTVTVRQRALLCSNTCVSACQ